MSKLLYMMYSIFVTDFSKETPHEKLHRWHQCNNSYALRSHDRWMSRRSATGSLHGKAAHPAGDSANSGAPQPTTYSIQDDGSAWKRSPHMHTFYDTTVATFSHGTNINVDAYEAKSFAIFREFARANGVSEDAMLDHLKLIPRQVVGIVKENPAVLKSYDDFLDSDGGTGLTHEQSTGYGLQATGYRQELRAFLTSSPPASSQRVKPAVGSRRPAVGRWQGSKVRVSPAAGLTANGSLRQRSSAYCRRPLELGVLGRARAQRRVRRNAEGSCHR